MRLARYGQSQENERQRLAQGFCRQEHDEPAKRRYVWDPGVGRHRDASPGPQASHRSVWRSGRAAAHEEVGRAARDLPRRTPWLESQTVPSASSAKTRSASRNAKTSFRTSRALIAPARTTRWTRTASATSPAAIGSQRQASAAARTTRATEYSGPNVPGPTQAECHPELAKDPRPNRSTRRVT